MYFICDISVLKQTFAKILNRTFSYDFLCGVLQDWQLIMVSLLFIYTDFKG